MLRLYTYIYPIHMQCRVEQTRLQTYIMCTFDIFQQQENMNHPIFILLIPLLIFPYNEHTTMSTSRVYMYIVSYFADKHFSLFTFSSIQLSSLKQNLALNNISLSKLFQNTSFKFSLRSSVQPFGSQILLNVG